MKRKQHVSRNSSLDRRRFLQATLASSLAGVGNAMSPPPRRQTDPNPGAEKPIYLVDLDRCQPQSALSRKPLRNRWRLLDYRTDAFTGVMLVAGQNTDAPEISYPLAQRGWHAIYIGLRSYGGGEDASHLQVRLENDSAFSLIVHQPDPRSPNRIDDMFWKCADLRGQQIVFRQLCRQVVPHDPSSVGNPCDGAWIAYIKLVPLF